MPRLPALLAALLVAAAAAAAGARAADDNHLPLYHDACVVGAGPAGLAAAVALSRRNRSVALLERRDGVGGQGNATWTDAAGFRLNMGAVIFAPVEDVRVMAFAKELGIGWQVRGRRGEAARRRWRRTNATADACVRELHQCKPDACGATMGGVVGLRT